MKIDNTIEEAYEEYLNAAYRGKVDKRSQQWKEMRKAFYAGIIYGLNRLITKPEEDNIKKLVDEAKVFYDEIARAADLVKAIERAGR